MITYTPEQVNDIFERFGLLSVMVIGDVMVDSYLWGKVNRISPEAPVPVVEVTRRTNRLGGAANVALNLRAIGARPYLCSVIGKDDKAVVFNRLLKDNNLFTEGILQSSQRITTTKFRVIGNNTQMLRVDEEVNTPLESDDHEKFLALIQQIINSVRIDAIVFQDYDKGVITPGLICKIVELAGEMKIPIVVDPKKRNFSNYRNVTLFKPNIKELSEGLGVSLDGFTIDKLRQAVRLLHKKLHTALILATLSDDGIFISRQHSDGTYSDQHIPAHLRSIADVSGAGDTVVSLACLALAAGMTDYEIAAISNLAGGQVCEMVGVVPVDRTKLMSELLNRKL
ncbi:MAG: D-glycero-beta-D-manno-heptose-7-phosphate kinase [Bacteroidales bacterium]|nr:D-glycero-beta-D-manno-heptose-7-phosphate kinase [Bacteroidales bacterium]